MASNTDTCLNIRQDKLISGKYTEMRNSVFAYILRRTGSMEDAAVNNYDNIEYPVKGVTLEKHKANSNTIIYGDSRPLLDEQGNNSPYAPSRDGATLIAGKGKDSHLIYPNKTGTAWYASPYLRHSNRANFSFFDGHAAGVDAVELENLKFRSWYNGKGFYIQKPFSDVNIY